jgi:hypothetical protein
MQKWEEPKVVKLDALPEVLGTCGGGQTVKQGACNAGLNPSQWCTTGGNPRPA